MIRLQPATADQRELWTVLLDLASQSEEWTLVGARMVELHAWRVGRSMTRTSRDGDALADARERPNPVRKIAQILVSANFTLTSRGVMGTGHEFTRGDVQIDLLAPEGLGQTSEQARTTVPPFHTVEVPGGTQALRRSEWVDVELGGRVGRIPCPNLVGAILIKARAIGVDQRPEDQRRDLALLLSLVDDPRPMSDALTTQERSWLRRYMEFNDEGAFFWRELGPDTAQRGLAAYRYLTEV